MKGTIYDLRLYMVENENTFIIFQGLLTCVSEKTMGQPRGYGDSIKVIPRITDDFLG